MSALIGRARAFATSAHQRIDQRRKYDGRPYEVHLEAVARLVAETAGDDEMVAAAWLHDVVEDTPATVEELQREFGPGVAALVADLTDVSRPSDGNRAARKEIDRAHTALASPRAKTIKLADLIDNCEDITRHDRRFARTYLAEMGSLLAVLAEGDARLLQRARTLHQASLRALQEPPPAAAAPAAAAPEGLVALMPQLASPHVARVFREAFTAGDIVDPLLSFDAERPQREVARAMAARPARIAAIRVGGSVQGYVQHADLDGAGAPSGTRMRRIAPSQVVDTDAPLTDVVGVLTRHDQCFVATFGAVVGVIERDAVNQPVVRMWLFGAVTLYEMGLVALVTRTFPDGAWRDRVTPARLQKALALQQERERRGRRCELVDCLQLSDKAQIMLDHPPTLEAMGMASKKAAKRVIRELESLRNQLVHSQDIVSHDWVQIIRITQRVAALGSG